MTPDQITSKIKAQFPDSKVEVRDYTGGGDHYEVVIQTAAFKGLSRILQHRAVMQVFDAELKSGEIHAFTLRTSDGTE